MTPKTALDWLSVQLACEGKPMKLRYPDEKRAVVRFYDNRMLKYGDNPVDLPPGMLTAADVARLIGTTPRSVQRIRSELRPARKRRCPSCSEPMWRCDDGSVEPHPDRWNETCHYYGAVEAMAS